MNCLHKLKTYFVNAFINNKKFIIIPYNKQYHSILLILLKEKYLKNFTYIISKTNYNYYIFIEFIYYNNKVKEFKITVFNTKFNYMFKSFKFLNKLYKFFGIFIINTKKGLLTLEELSFLKIGGVLILHIL